MSFISALFSLKKTIDGHLGESTWWWLCQQTLSDVQSWYSLRRNTITYIDAAPNVTRRHCITWRPRHPSLEHQLWSEFRNLKMYLLPLYFFFQILFRWYDFLFNKSYTSQIYGLHDQRKVYNNTCQLLCHRTELAVGWNKAISVNKHTRQKQTRRLDIKLII